MGKIKLADISTRPPKDYYKNKKKYKEEQKDMAKEIGKLHEIMFAEVKNSLLVVLQGMDSSGKDGATRETFKYCSPNGINATSFKKPTDEEFAHDFLWRVHKLAPKKGTIRVFIRSHYEDILIQRVHKWIDEEHVTKRINAINAWEDLIQFDNNTTILKFYMHLSEERQGEKLQERIDDPEKNWKHNAGDWDERKLWDQYRDAYEDAINRSTTHWIVAPVDSRTYRNWFITKKVLETMRAMKMELPTLDK